jgi:dephospho-CoA kinase
MVLGLTGGIACGKSTLALSLQKDGWQVVESDECAHALMEPGAENYQNVIDLFGSAILNPDRTINRRALGEIVFGDSVLREQLNQAVHPAIRRAWKSQRDYYRNQNPDQPIVIVIPLLFELQMAAEFDSTACVACRPERQWHQLRQRGLSEKEARQRLQSQWPLFEKIKAATYMIWNEGSFEALAAQGRRLPRN